MDLIRNNLGKNDKFEFLSPFDAENYKVVYAIVTEKPKDNKSANLPLFSRISLMHSIKMLKLMNANPGFCFIKNIRDNRDKKKIIKKSRKKKLKII